LIKSQIALNENFNSDNEENNKINALEEQKEELKNLNDYIQKDIADLTKEKFSNVEE